MGWFSRRGGGRSGPDEALPFLDVGQAAELRSLVARAFAERGLEVTVHPDHVVDSAGGVYGLWNVATACHHDERGRSAWPDVVADHVRRVLTELDTDPFAELTAEDVADRTYLRLWDEASLPDRHGYPHREFAPGVVELLALDLPESVAIFTREHARRHGGFGTLREHAVRNLGRLPVDELERVEGPRGSVFHLLGGESVYTAGLAVLLPDLSTRLLGETPGPYGWLLSVPHRHQLAWHPVRDSTVFGAVEGLATFAALGYEDAAGPVSPHVYWSDGHGYHRLTRHDDDGQVAIVVPPGLQEALEQISRDT